MCICAGKINTWSRTTANNYTTITDISIYICYLSLYLSRGDSSGSGDVLSRRHLVQIVFIQAVLIFKREQTFVVRQNEQLSENVMTYGSLMGNK